MILSRPTQLLKLFALIAAYLLAVTYWPFGTGSLIALGLVLNVVIAYEVFTEPRSLENSTLSREQEFKE